jgi:hypothetical protein
MIVLPTLVAFLNELSDVEMAAFDELYNIYHKEYIGEITKEQIADWAHKWTEWVVEDLHIGVEFITEHLLPMMKKCGDMSVKYQKKLVEVTFYRQLLKAVQCHDESVLKLAEALPKEECERLDELDAYKEILKKFANSIGEMMKMAKKGKARKTKLLKWTKIVTVETNNEFDWKTLWHFCTGERL